ncbi:SHOCT domain-containing protein [Pseudooceanicola sp. C21-150M6]|uniref:SHOCT domain-containing protein n=1 Tax=Pseudooceanicola sp. C21-150M6 TaxID=3434355 RepID=UPI003D7F7037
MTGLTPEGTRLVSEIAARHGVSAGAVETLLAALVVGNGTQAQFNHPDLGGMGQWSQGGMIMVGDMFNNGLKAKVDALCSELSQVLASHRAVAPARQSQSQSDGVSLFVSGMGTGSSWPAELGQPSSAGSQNNMRYAVFPQTRRLAIDLGGQVEVFDTGDHQIGGVSQQQSGDQSLTFTSQLGLVRLADLPRVSLDGTPGPEPREVEEAPVEVAPPAPAEPAPAVTEPEPAAAPTPSSQGPAQSADEIIGLIRKLADLRDGGILSDAEFEAKKQELLARL